MMMFYKLGSLLSLLLLFINECHVFGASSEDEITEEEKHTQKEKLIDFDEETGFDGREFTIVLHVDHPFVFFNEDLRGNERFSGLTVDVLELLQDKLKCTMKYKLASFEHEEQVIPTLEAVGAFNHTVGATHWADIAAGAIHITSERASLVHFSQPYFDTGYVLVVKRPETRTYDPWSFIKPFGNSLWWAIIAEIFIVAFALQLVEGNVSKFFSTVDDSDLAEGKISGSLDALYWSSSIFTGTEDKKPRSWGGKVIIMGHAFFMLILVASYTANLASFMTNVENAPKVESWTDLSLSKGAYKLAIPHGMFQEEFLHHEERFYGYEYNYILTETWEESLEKVLHGEVDATFIDKGMVQYYFTHEMQEQENPCGLMMVGGLFAPVGYGLAFGYDSADFIPFSQAIIDLKENGEIARLQEQQKYNVGVKAEIFLHETCDGSDDSEEFTLLEFGGLFIMVGVTIFAGLLVQVLHRGAEHTTKSFRKYSTRRKVFKSRKVLAKEPVSPLTNTKKKKDLKEFLNSESTIPSLEEMLEPAMYSAFERLLSKDSDLLQNVIKATVDNHFHSPSSTCSPPNSSSNDDNDVEVVATSYY